MKSTLLVSFDPYVRQAANVARRRLLLGALAFAAVAVIGATSGKSAYALDDLDLLPVGTHANPVLSATPAAGNQYNNSTSRQIERISIGGNQIRVKFSNRHGNAPLTIGAAGVALRATNQNIVPGTARPLTFAGNASYTIPAGGEILSDWSPLDIPPLSDIAIDLWIPGNTGTTAASSPLTQRSGALQTNYITAQGAGNQVGTPGAAFPSTGTRTVWHFIAGTDVLPTVQTGTVVAFGDSITEGLASTSNSNSRWPDQLARRLMALDPSLHMGVVNLGISGNRVTSGAVTNPNSLWRFDPDALVRPGATHVVVLLGINDLNGGVSAADVIAAHRQLITRAHSRDLKIIGGTVTPFNTASAAVNNGRLAVNDFIRNSGEYDGIADFDLAIRNPANPNQMLPIYNSGDGLHPSNAGYTQMGNSIDLNLLQFVPRIARNDLPPLDLQVVPSVINLRTALGLVTCVITTGAGYDLRGWGIADVKAEGAPAVSIAYSSDGRTLVATFNKADLASVPAGDNVTITVGGMFNRNGAQAVMVASAVARVLR